VFILLIGKTDPQEFEWLCQEYSKCVLTSGVSS
jgi:hypothetical protein